MERIYQQYLYEEQGRASMLGLLALVDSLGELPGRKTVLYFCEGLTIPDCAASAIPAGDRYRQPQQRQRLYIRLGRASACRARSSKPRARFAS